MTWLDKTFGKPKVAIGMVHLAALPGSPLYDDAAGMPSIIEEAAQDLVALQDAGFDGVMFCNENDRPYVFEAGPETVAAMTTVVCALLPRIEVPFGVDVLWDPRAAIAIAKVVGAAFVREVLTGAYASDFGVWNTSIGETMRYRRQIDATGVKIMANISAEFAQPLADRPLEKVAKGVDLIALADAMCVSGPMTGSSVDPQQLKLAREAVPGAVLFANTGVNEDTIEKVLSSADGVVVGTSVKVDGVTWNPVSTERAAKFMKRFEEVRAQFATATERPDS